MSGFFLKDGKNHGKGILEERAKRIAICLKNLWKYLDRRGVICLDNARETCYFYEERGFKNNTKIKTEFFSIFQFWSIQISVDFSLLVLTVYENS